MFSSPTFANSIYLIREIKRFDPTDQTWMKIFCFCFSSIVILAKLRRCASRGNLWLEKVWSPKSFGLKNFGSKKLGDGGDFQAPIKSCQFVGAQRRWQNGNPKVWRTNLRTEKSNEFSTFLLSTTFLITDHVAISHELDNSHHWTTHRKRDHSYPPTDTRSCVSGSQLLSRRSRTGH